MSRKLNWPFYVQRFLLPKFSSADVGQQQRIFQMEKKLALDKTVTNEGAKDFNPIVYNKHLLSYIIGESFMSLKDIKFLHSIVNPILGEDPQNHSCSLLLRAMERVGYVRFGDNIFRRRMESRLRLPHKAHSFAERCKKADDVLHSVRKSVHRNVYAVDSKSTFEVDDGISYHKDERGREIVTVHVADVTSFCSVDSELDRMSGMKLRTTTYLPEGVWCMLPRPLIDVATLQENHNCRTFDVSFSLDANGEVEFADVGVSLIHNLRRITYDTCQEIIERVHSSTSNFRDALPWLSADDIRDLVRLNELRLLRREKRLRSGCWKLIKPKPRVTVRGVNTENDITIEQKHDESLMLRDAYNFVEEFMIAANEACSRIAIDNGISIPFRVTRPLSSRHEEINNLLPEGAHEITVKAEKAEKLDLFKLAKSITQDTLTLRGVTRAYYSAEIGFHSFLNTSLYCHATSPLRRYADMLVHHQLKSFMARRCGINHHSLQLLDVTTMREECRKTSKITGDIKVLDNQSSYFWALRSLENQVHADRSFRVLAIAVSNIRIDSSPTIAPLAEGFQYASQIVLCQLLLVVILYHNCSSLSPGDFALCQVQKIDPLGLVLQLSLDRVLSESHVKSFYNIKSFSEGFSYNEDV